MSQWYYSGNGLQNGPVPFEQLRELAAAGTLKPNDLVWNESMKDWLPASSVDGIFGSSANPYAASPTSWTDASPSQPAVALEEIPHGSDPLNPVACIKRGFTLLFRHFAILLLIAIVYIGITVVLSVALELMDNAIGWGSSPAPVSGDSRAQALHAIQQNQGSPLNLIISQVVGVLLMLGLKRILLNLISGGPLEVGLLFRGGPLLLKAIGANILFYLAVGIGMLLFFVPGIYIALRYGFFFTAIVDRNLGIIEAFKYSSSITTNNRLNVLVLFVLFFCLGIAGLLALCVGVFIAAPVCSIAFVVAYRWLQYGHRAVLDHPGTEKPMLSL